MQEFFQLVFRDLFDASYGMFVGVDAASRAHWPRASDIDMRTEFQLVGTMLGLAVYNGHTLGVALPPALWRKLLRAPVGLADLAGVQPEVHRSLARLLALPAAAVADLGLVFQARPRAPGRRPACGAPPRLCKDTIGSEPKTILRGRPAGATRRRRRRAAPR